MTTLSSAQSAIVNFNEGEALVAAGAGSGKTHTLVARVVALVESGVDPRGIALLAYNKDAAAEIRSRLVQALGFQGRAVAASTFHGFGYQQLQRCFPDAKRFGNGRILGLPDSTVNQYGMVYKIMRDLKLEGEAADWLSVSDSLRESLIDVTSPDVAQSAIALAQERLGMETTAATLAVRFSVAYQEAKRTSETIDFTDMIYGMALMILAGRMTHLRSMFRHVMIDEAQDSNPARWLIAKYLGADAQSFMSVGDLRQSIYGFSGARPELFVGRLEAGATMLTLPTNFRSAASIVALGNAIAEGQDWNLGGAIDHRDDASQGSAELWRTDEGSESTQIAAEIASVLGDDWTPTDLTVDGTESGSSRFALLARTKAQGAMAEVALAALNIPVRILGGGCAWQSTQGRDLIAFLRAAEGSADVSLCRVANKPLRYCRRIDVEDALKTAQGDLRALVGALWDNDRSGAQRFADALSDFIDQPFAKCARIAASFLEDDIIARSEASVGDAVNDDRIALIHALADAAATLGSCAAIDAHVAAMQEGRKGPAVEISTLHRSKGQEWDVVFVMGVGEVAHKEGAWSFLPFGLNAGGWDEADIAEERRLFYVGVTRAKSRVVVSTGGSPSRFINDLPASVWTETR